MKFSEQLHLAKTTKHIHSTWYRENYPEVAALGLDPSIHYLRYGAAMGRNPGKNFDTQFYLDTYPDAASSGLNPLVHYALHGRAAGYTTRPQRDDPRKQINVIRTKLLSLGFTERPLAELTEIATTSPIPEARALAARELALWHMRAKTDDDYRTALGWIARARPDAPDLDFRSKLSTVELLCHYHLNDHATGLAAYDRAALAGEATPDLTLARVNYAQTPQDRVLWINQVLARYGIEPVTLLPDHGQPAYDRLTCAQDLPRITDGPKVTVLIAAYDAADMLPTALRSLQEQTWTNLEIIVLDDCSPSPDTIRVAQEFAANDPRIQVVRIEQNDPTGELLNNLLKDNSEKAILVSSSNQWTHPKKIQNLMQSHGCNNKKFNIDICFSNELVYQIPVSSDLTEECFFFPSDEENREVRIANLLRTMSLSKVESTDCPVAVSLCVDIDGEKDTIDPQFKDNNYPYIKEAMKKYDPAILDIQYGKGPIISDKPLKHDELVSIIMPSYNNEKWLTRALNSALSQTGVNIEIIVVDDGSTDGSVKIANQISQHAPNLRVISLLKNFGCYYARNIGLLNANGKYIAILDTDDIMTPDRIERQLSAIKSAPNSVASWPLQRRWSSDFLKPLIELKHGENSLLWRKDIIEKIGFYDSVKYGGDSEFRSRLQASFGADKIVKMQDELYFVRLVENSLAFNANNGVFKFEKDLLNVQPSPSRIAYEKCFKDWHKSKNRNLYIEFPMADRHFDLGGEDQDASPSLCAKRVGMMASFPLREETLKSTLPLVLPQLDELHLYLNDYEEIPEFLKDPKIKCVLGSQALGDLRDNGKFFNVPLDDNSYCFTLDDDINYPKDYIAKMLHYIEVFQRQCIVGVHGVIFPQSEFSLLKQRKVFHFKDKENGHFVDLLGTGTVAWHSSTFKPSLSDFLTKGVCDLWFAAAASRLSIPLFCVPRPQNWLSEFKQHDVSLWREAATEPRGYFEVYERSIAPVINKGAVRKNMTAHLGRCYDFDTLKAAGVEIPSVHARNSIKPVLSRRTTSILSRITDIDGRRNSPNANTHFDIVVNGWNCRNLVSSCLRSIAQQKMGNFSFDVTLVDDCSDDGTFEAMANSVILPGAKLIRTPLNMGPAFARHSGITSIKNTNSIVVLLDLDDALEPHALRTVAKVYQENPSCMMTIGNWHDQDGIVNPQGFYSAEEIDEQRVREVDLFNATHLRTFRRTLYDAITVDDLLDRDGKWLETCTDVALMYPLIDQCFSNEVVFISEPIYRYNRQLASGTLARFGKPHKVERLNWLKGKKPKQRMERP